MCKLYSTRNAITHFNSSSRFIVAVAGAHRDSWSWLVQPEPMKAVHQEKSVVAEVERMIVAAVAFQQATAVVVVVVEAGVVVETAADMPLWGDTNAARHPVRCGVVAQILLEPPRFFWRNNQGWGNREKQTCCVRQPFQPESDHI